jgi:cardiolipin synthase
VRQPGFVINAPNLLTLLRILATPLFIIFLIREQFGLALLVFSLAGVTDGLDGLLARWFNQKTILGAHLDPVADKLLLTSAFVTLAVQSLIPSWLTVIVISRDVLILLGIAMLELFHVKFEVHPSLISKCTTAVQLATVFLSLLTLQFPAALPANLPAHWLTAALTILSGLHYIYVGIRILHTNGPRDAS